MTMPPPTRCRAAAAALPGRTVRLTVMRRVLRAVVLGALGPAALALMLGGCLGPGPAAPLRWLQMPLEVPLQASQATAAPAASASTPVWALSRDVALPASLDRDAVVVASSDTELRTLPGTRWAEPLRDAVPRLLRHDLGVLRGDDRVWLAPAPVGDARVLRVELQQLQWRSDRGVVQLQARWWLGEGRPAPGAAQAAGTAPPGQAGQATLEVPAATAGTDEGQALVRAHRQALWLLAQRIAASAP